MPRGLGERPEPLKGEEVIAAGPLAPHAVVAHAALDLLAEARLRIVNSGLHEPRVAEQVPGQPNRRVEPATLNELSQLLSRLPQKGCPTLSDYPTILAVVARLVCNPTASLPGQSTPCLLDRVRPLLAAAHPLSAIARQTGYHRDHLTRKLKNETGFGLRATRDRMRLEAAQNALRGEASIAEASTKAGFDDPNYFARWFRRQTGLTPSAFLDT